MGWSRSIPKEPSSARPRVFEATDPWSWVWTRSCPLRPHARWSQQPRHREAATPGPADSWHLISVTIPSSLILLELTQSKLMSGLGHSNKQNLQIISQLQYLVQFIQSRKFWRNLLLFAILYLPRHLSNFTSFIVWFISLRRPEKFQKVNRVELVCRIETIQVGRWKRMDLFYI